MTRLLAIGDIHGCARALDALLGAIKPQADDVVVFLGDYVDRGPDSRKVIARLMGGLSHEGWRLICLKGNHEDIMWQTCRRKVPDCGWWLDNGGGATLISYGQNEGDQADVTVVLEEHLKWIERLPLMYVDKHRIFVHAGVNPNYPLDEQDLQDVIWKIYDDRDEGGHGQRHIIYGPSPARAHARVRRATIFPPTPAHRPRAPRFFPAWPC